MLLLTPVFVLLFDVKMTAVKKVCTRHAWAFHTHVVWVLTHWKLANLYKTKFQSHHSIPNAKDPRIWQIIIHNFASARLLSNGNQQTNWILKMWYSSCCKYISRIRRGQGPKKDWKAKKTFFVFERLEEVQQGPGRASWQLHWDAKLTLLQSEEVWSGMVFVEQ